uniref:Uncharacterized protein n=1 Tax=Romanomermis culicivorax TaxID=13658 RepID=A0A915JTD2_ROMCU
MLIKIIVFVVVSTTYALDLEDPRLGAIPVLSTTQGGRPGVCQTVRDDAEKERIKTYINDNIKKLEARSGRSGSPRHLLVDLHEAIEQQVQGKNIKVIFSVGQVKANAPQTIDEYGQYGKCYFKLHLPSNVNEAVLQEHACIKIIKTADHDDQHHRHSQ